MDNDAVEVGAGLLTAEGGNLEITTSFEKKLCRLVSEERQLSKLPTDFFVDLCFAPVYPCCGYCAHGKNVYLRHNEWSL